MSPSWPGHVSRLMYVSDQMFQRLQDQGFYEVFGETIRGYVL